MKIITKERLNAEDVRESTERLLHERLSLQVEGYKITTSMVLNVLLKAAVEKRSIEAVCADLGNVVDSNTLREARFFFLALALLLLKVWAYLRCLCTRVIAKGPFRLDLNRFRLSRYIAFLRRAIEQLLERPCPSRSILGSTHGDPSGLLSRFACQ
jgi:hypothetical protein